MSSLCFLVLSACLAAPPKPAPAAPVTSTEAEKISRLQRNIAEDEKQLAAVSKQLADPAGEYARAQAAFKELDEKLVRSKKAKVPEKELADLQKQWQRGRDRFDLAIQERKTLKEKLATLPDKIERQRRVLQRLAGETAPVVVEKKPAEEIKKPKSPVEAKPPAAENLVESAKVRPARESRKLREAREKAKAKEDAAQLLRDKVKSINEYSDGLKRQIELEQRLLETARKKVALARQTQAELGQEQKQRVAAKAGEAEVARGWEQINDAVRRVDEAGADERDISDRLADLQTQLGRVQAREIQVLQEAKAGDEEAAKAQKNLENLENPLHPRNILRWFAEHGGRMLAILLGMVSLYLLVRTGTRHIVRVMSNARKRRSGRESEDRAETLIGVFRNTMSAFILGGGALMLLDEIGIPIVPLMGGAAVIGLAVAFGAQNLIKDYFTGFMVLLEDQYAVNDVVKIDNIEGQVERITLRMTVLRDLAGVAHFIPHGTIRTVSNMTHGWSRTMLEIGVAYKEDPDHVMDVLRDLCAELRRDDHFGPLMLEDAEILGVDHLGDHAVVLKLIVKTRPLKQWDVKRELLRRIKRRFDQLGIEIPFPHRTVHHRRADGSVVDAPRLVA